MSRSHLLSPPRLCLQGRSLSAREYESPFWEEEKEENEGQTQNIGEGDNKNTMMVARVAHLSASTDQLQIAGELFPTRKIIPWAKSTGKFCQRKIANNECSVRPIISS